MVSLALMAGATSASAAVQPQKNGSDGGLYIYDTNGEFVTDGSTVFGWETDAYGASDELGYTNPTYCPAESTEGWTFMSAPGDERTAAAWQAFRVNGFNPGTVEIVAATLNPIQLILGLPGQSGIKAAGGTYSLGVACTINNGVTVVGAFYRTVTVTAGTGDYVFSPIEAAGVPEVPAEESETVQNIALAPTILAPENGVLSLEVPTGAAATFATPTLVNNVSTTTGTLGAVTVNDGRFLTKEGWDLTANVVDFTNSADPTSTIGKSQLGIAPSVTAAGTVATGVTAAAPQVAGSATYPAAFASGAAANTTGLSVLNADLTFVAPQAKAAGTYNSTLTLTVVSK
ncbi:hypothetical protein C3B60_10405 [Cryobacterium zongtaii]|nr:hypothetical protein C3B60_10405 [Cryobacterium zongtaii]